MKGSSALHQLLYGRCHVNEPSGIYLRTQGHQAETAIMAKVEEVIVKKVGMKFNTFLFCFFYF